MPPLPLYPTLYEINTRILLGETAPGATLDDLPDALLDGLAARGIDIVWMLGVWQTGAAGRQVSRTWPGWRDGFRADLPDVTDNDICGSPFAIQAYTVHRDFGGDAALARLRQRLRQRGLRLVLDFVPNHTALDHSWTQTNPEFYIHGSEADLAREPRNWCRVPSGRGSLILAHGRDPYFPGWPDTLQLNYRHAGLRAAMRAELLAVADRCDGVRCDMAMLLLPDVFLRTWGDAARPPDPPLSPRGGEGEGEPHPPLSPRGGEGEGEGAPVDEPFWPDAVAGVKGRHPEFVLLAEVYWDLEWVLQQQGFQYTYDKRLYDRLRAKSAGPVRMHLAAPLAFQNRCARFLENHDEPRAAAVFPPDVHGAAAVLTFLTPGMRFFHEGQFEGRRAHANIHLARRRKEPVDGELQTFYTQILDCLKRPMVRQGRWEPYACRSAWEGNPTADQFIAFGWSNGPGPRLLGAVHYGSTRGQCYVELPWPELRGKKVLLRDLLSSAQYERNGDELRGRGLYLDMAAWGHHLFEVIVK